MNWKHYAVLSAPILVAIAAGLQSAAGWSAVLTPANVGKVLAETAIVLGALNLRSPRDTKAARKRAASAIVPPITP